MIKTLKGIGKIHWVTGSLLMLILLSWVGYQQWIIDKSVEIVRLPFDPACDLRAGPCETILADGSRVSFAIEPRSILVSEKLKFEVIVSGLDIDSVSVDINGVDMKMPPNIVELKQAGNELYTGSGALSFCTRSIMEWESVIQLNTGSKIIKVPYRFITSTELY
ncbi:MAG: hypothetical protein KAU21_02285 [Gammaproteobacteria bacterium]|nr:hypothetical protein [Gammaproteobacteria bacterium]